MHNIGWKTLERRNFGNVVAPLPSEVPGRDQAEGVRRLARQSPKTARVLAITSGKGGVGKTNITVNLALALAAEGQRVVVVDLDLGLANADLLFDLTPRYTLSHVLSGQRSIDEVIVTTPGGIRLVPGTNGVEQMANLSEPERRALLSSFEALHRSSDFILFDTGAGISRNTTGFLTAADDIIVVTMPEPTAVLDAYAVIKTVAAHSDRGNLHVLVNMAEGRAEADRIAGGISTTAGRLLNTYVEKLGYVLRDPRVGEAVRRRRPFLLDHTSSPAGQCVRTIAERLVRSSAGAMAERPGFLHRLWTVFTGKR